MATLLDHLGRACRDARRRASLRQIDIATPIGVRDTTLGRFEKGERIPRDLDGTVRAYATETGTTPRELWLTALATWEAEHEGMTT